MADNKSEPTPEASGAAAPGSAPSPSIVKKLAGLPMLQLVNILAVLGAGGFAYYSKILYKRPPILEEKERERIAAEAQQERTEGAHVDVRFGPITANIASTPTHPRPADRTSEQIEGKLHYVTLTFSMNISDDSKQDLIETIRPVFLDKMNQILGKKEFHELNSIQGRYLLQSQFIDIANRLVNEATGEHNKEPLVTNIYFTQFLVQ